VKRVLITGGSGFVGRHCLLPLADAGFELHVASRQRISPSPGTWHSVDLLEPVATASLLEEVRPTHLLHAAWYLEPGRYAMSLENFRWASSSLMLLDQFLLSGGHRAVMLGSCFEYSWDQPVLREDTPLAPRTVYGRCKASLSELVTAFGDSSELSTAWARLFFLYGPHEDRRRLVASVAASLLAGNEARCTDGRQERDYMFIEDASQALCALLDSPVEGAVNVATGDATPVAEIVKTLSDQIGRPDLLRLGALATAPDDPPRLVADVTRLRTEVGWNHVTSMSQGLAATVDYWRRELGDLA
jgi:nucleoside-diphosphate-sugar epimerase